jgi:hypothetical protein
MCLADVIRRREELRENIVQPLRQESGSPGARVDVRDGQATNLEVPDSHDFS